jgi:hypothetical protein
MCNLQRKDCCFVNPTKYVLVYTEENKKEVTETFEDIQSELSALRIPFVKKKGFHLSVGGSVVSLMNVERLARTKTSYTKIYAPKHVQHSIDTDLNRLTGHSIYYDRSFQFLVDIVLDLKSENQEPAYI